MSFAQLLSRAAQINPREGGSRQSQRGYNWAQLEDRTKHAAHGLLKLDLKPGDRVGIAAANGDEFFQAMLAISWAGGVVAPLNLRLAGREILDQIADSATAFMICDATGYALLKAISQELESLRCWIYVGNEVCPDGCLPYESLFSSREQAIAIERKMDDLALLKYTGGTTGRSKGVMLSNRNIIFSGMASLATGPISQSDSWLITAPMFHVGATILVVSAMMAAGTIYYMTKFDPSCWLEIVSAKSITRSGMVPTMLKAILEHPQFEEYNLSRLVSLIYGGAAMPVPILVRASRKIPHVQFFQQYGQTESMGGGTFLSNQHHDPSSPKLASAGQAGPGVALKIVDFEGNSVSTNMVGEICVTGDCVMMGYLNQPELTSKALQRGWLHTGDVGYLDEDGFLFVVDRLKDMIITGGENVFCAEVENAIYAFPHVAECAVFGVNDDRWGERVHAVVRLATGYQSSESELIAHCRTLIADYKCPKAIVFRDEPMPLSAIGKIKKNELRMALRDRP